MTGDLETKIIRIILMVLAFIPAIVLHEVAHGYAAYKMGDPTAKNLGRLSLNPLKHIDPFGSVILPGLLILYSAVSGGPGMIFGYAKPVPYDPRNLRNVRVGEVVVGLVGPATNLVLSLVGAGIAWGGLALYQHFPSIPELGFYIWFFGNYFCMINLCLAFFNLIPLPPLDGSSIIAFFLSNNALRVYYKIQQYSMAILLLIIFILPYFIHVDLISLYLNYTAVPIANLILP